MWRWLERHADHTPQKVALRFEGREITYADFEARANRFAHWGQSVGLKKGDTVDAVVLAVDPERERISLGIKQLEQDPFGQYMAANPKGSILNGVVRDVDAKGATVELAEGIEGYIRASDIAKERVEDATAYLKPGDKVEAKFMGMDRKGRTLQLSIRAKDEADLRDTLEEYSSASGGTTKLGALLREQLGKSE